MIQKREKPHPDYNRKVNPGQSGSISFSTNPFIGFAKSRPSRVEYWGTPEIQTNITEIPFYVIVPIIRLNTAQDDFYKNSK